MSTLLLMLAACQSESNLYGGKANAGSYNPPDPPVKEQVDEITQVTIPAVDVLWVIDNSGSMAEEQSALQQNFGDFIKYFTNSGMDYHVGVVSTDMDNKNETGQLIKDNSGNDRYIDTSYKEADALKSFRERANLGTLGSSDERGKDAAYVALTTQKDRTNKGFYRDDASLSIIVISDEVDHSKLVTVNEFVSFLDGLKAGTNNVVTFSSVVGLTRNDCGTTEMGTGYLEVTRQVGGVEWSICTSDWAGLLEELGLQAAGLKREFYLSLAPVEDSITVEVTGDDGWSGKEKWKYDATRNSVKFDTYIPAPLSVVTVTYMPLATYVEETDTAVVE